MLAEADGELQVILIATGSEGAVGTVARDTLQSKGRHRVVSMPCTVVR